MSLRSIPAFAASCVASALLVACNVGSQGLTPLSTAPIGDASSAQPKPVAKPKALTFSSAKVQKIIVKDKRYIGLLSAKSSNLKVAKVTPSSRRGPSATFTVTPIGGGTSTITVKNDQDRKVTISVTVDNGIIIIDQSSPKR